MGTQLQDQSGLYNPHYDTIKPNEMTICTVFDTNLKTSGYFTAVIGRYSDNNFGMVNARMYTQLEITGNSGLDLTEYTIDSAFLSLYVTKRYPNSHDQVLHLRVSRMAEGISKDTSYYAHSKIALTGEVYYDHYITCRSSDTLIRIPLNSTFCRMLEGQVFATQEELEAYMHGLCVEVLEGSMPALLTLDMAKGSNGITLFYTQGEEVKSYNMMLGYSATTCKAMHFTQFEHTYKGALLQLQQGLIDSIAGDERLYLEPFAGTGVKITMDSYIQRFHEKHPRAVVHYAELILPVADPENSNHPMRIVAYKRYKSGSLIYINDLISSTDGNSYDGTYDTERQQYRIRITQHLLDLFCTGRDYGTTLYLDGRRSEAARTVLYGTKTDRPPYITFTYTE